MKRRWMFLMLVLALAGVATFSAAGVGASSAAPQKKIVIGYIDHIASIPFVQLVKNSVVAAAKKAGAKIYTCESNGDAQAAVNCAAQFKTEGVQGILNFQPVQAAGPRVCAAGPKVPVIAFDIVQKPCQTVFYGANNAQAGFIAGQGLGQFAKKQFNCKIDAMVSMEAPAVGVVNFERANGMVKGFSSVCGAPPNLTHVDGKGTTDTAIQPATDTLTRLTGDHTIMVISLNDDMAIGMIKAAQSANRLGDIYVAGQGADPTSWPYLCGKDPFKNWEADTAYFPELYGNRTVPILINLIKGKKEPKTVYTNHKLVTPSNISSIYPQACK